MTKIEKLKNIGDELYDIKQKIHTIINYLETTEEIDKNSFFRMVEANDNLTVAMLYLGNELKFQSYELIEKGTYNEDA